jgi:hypothetical protein
MPPNPPNQSAQQTLKQKNAVPKEAARSKPFNRAHSQAPTLMIDAVKKTKNKAFEAKTAGTKSPNNTTAVRTRCLSTGKVHASDHRAQLGRLAEHKVMHHRAQAARPP